MKFILSYFIQISKNFHLPIAKQNNNKKYEIFYDSRFQAKIESMRKLQFNLTSDVFFTTFCDIVSGNWFWIDWIKIVPNFSVILFGLFFVRILTKNSVKRKIKSKCWLRCSPSGRRHATEAPTIQSVENILSVAWWWRLIRYCCHCRRRCCRRSHIFGKLEKRDVFLSTIFAYKSKNGLILTFNRQKNIICRVLKTFVEK